MSLIILLGFTSGQARVKDRRRRRRKNFKQENFDHIKCKNDSVKCNNDDRKKKKKQFGKTILNICKPSMKQTRRRFTHKVCFSFHYFISLFDVLFSAWSFVTKFFGQYIQFTSKISRVNAKTCKTFSVSYKKKRCYEKPFSSELKRVPISYLPTLTQDISTQSCDPVTVILKLKR